LATFIHEELGLVVFRVTSVSNKINVIWKQYQNVNTTRKVSYVHPTIFVSHDTHCSQYRHWSMSSAKLRLDHFTECLFNSDI